VRTYVPLIRTFLNPIDPNGYRVGLASDDSLSVPWGFGISWDKIDAASKDVQNYGYTIRGMSMFLLDHYWQVPYTEWKDKWGTPHDDLFKQKEKEVVDEIESGFATAYQHIATMFNSGANFEAYSDSISKPLAGLLNRQLQDLRRSGMSPSVEVLNANAKLICIKVMPYSINKDYFFFKYLNPRFFMTFYTMGLYKNRKVNPLKLEFHVEINAAEKIDGNVVDNRHILVFGYLMQAFTSKDVSRDHKYCAPMLYNFNYALEHLPMGVTREEALSLSLPEDLVQLVK